jgi:beta-galactosidase
MKRSTIDLNGVWEIQPGEKERPPSRFLHTITVPSLVDCAGPSFDWRPHDFFWYRTTFRVDHGEMGRPAFLKLEQSMYGTVVWINGNLVGESISCYTSQEYRVDGFLRYGSENEVLVRVGQKHTLPPESAVGKDQERLSFIPGIWGDVKLVHTGSVRVKLIQILPRINESRVDANVWLENVNITPRNICLSAKVREKSSGEPASGIISDRLTLEPKSEAEITIRIPMPHVNLWSPDAPFLYVLTATLAEGDGSLIDELDVTFGMREFRIEGSDFLLNGKKIFLKGSNIAFHRFLSDKDRRMLPWNEGWIRKLLVEIPKAHNFNFFRAHLGHMYNRWYDIADEGGIMLQDEWQFWGATGTKEQISREFTGWLKDNWNHPSIVIWDPLNESSDAVVQNEIIPEMKKLDPTRPWESYDFFEDHPYIYSLGPVLVNRKFGCTRSLDEIENSTYPSQVNEYLWWWLDKDMKPSKLTEKVLTRWLGTDYTTDELVNHQSFLAAELTELFRRMDVKAIQPFVYLSCNEGPTSHWFKGDIAELTPKPVLATLKNAFEPFGVSVELWDRHFFLGEKRNLPIYLFNDYPSERRGRLRFGVKNEEAEWVCLSEINVELSSGERCKIQILVELPRKAGDFYITAEIEDDQTGRTARSQKTAHLYPDPPLPQSMEGKTLAVLEEADKVGHFLESHGLMILRDWNDRGISVDVLLVVGGAISGQIFTKHTADIWTWVESGGCLVVIEPERGVDRKAIVELPSREHLIVEPRTDKDQGGYDSYVIAEDHSHPLWQGIRKVDLRMFNGGFGGEMVPEYDLQVEGEHRVLARSGLGLKREVVVEKQIGKGLLIVSSIEIVDRLISSAGCYEDLLAPKPDPVAQRFLLNLVEYSSLHKSKEDKLSFDNRIRPKRAIDKS